MPDQASQPAPSVPSVVDDELLSVPEAAELCGVHVTTMWRWVRIGGVNAKRAGPHGLTRIARSEIDRIVVDRN
jgi:excisionase family DNA binding protein